MMKKNNLTISDYRYERKFFITELTNYEVESLVTLHPAIFFEIFHKRFVNNIYFDSFNLINFQENIEGATDRIKIRIRWYGCLLGYIEKPILEIKIRKGALGKKISIPIKPFNLTGNTNISSILKSIKYLEEFLMIDFQSLNPSLLNRYSRKYYLSNDKKFRITLDYDQLFYSIKSDNNTFLKQHNDIQSVIMELKYQQDYDKEASYITSMFPFRVTKSSKYVSGMQKILQVAF